MNAMKAAELTKQAKEQGLTPHRQALLKEIEAAANVGQSHITFEHPLNDDTVEWLQRLGYKVDQAEIKYSLAKSAPMSQMIVGNTHAGRISW